MRVHKKDCNCCVNRKIEDGCPYRLEYEESIRHIESFLHVHEFVEWWGGLYASCDYYGFDPELQEFHTCSGGA